MHYQKLNFNNSNILSTVLNDVYVISSEKVVMYNTVPNGILGISVLLSGHSSILRKGSWTKSPLCSTYGLIDYPDLIKNSANYKEISFGFKPYYFQLLVKEKMENITKEVCVDASLIFIKESVERLIDNLRNSKDQTNIILAIELFVLSNLIQNKYDERVFGAMNYIYSKKIVNIYDLSVQLNISTTRLRTIFKEKVGRSPKAIADIIRIDRILNTHKPNSSINLQDISFENGFFDLAHFNNSFKKKVGLPPKKYFLNDSLTFDFSNFGRWINSSFE